jgi:hypothetical protein
MQTPVSPKSFFASRRLLTLTLILLFNLSLAIRLYDLTDLPLDFHPTRQLLSALKARGMYDQTAPGVPEWQRRMSLQQWHARAEIEPEVMERLVAFTYSGTGEHLWVARIYSSVFWIIGGVFLFLLIRDLFSVDGAVIALAYYLFTPYAVIASRAFQPDPLMVLWLSLARVAWQDPAVGDGDLRRFSGCRLSRLRTGVAWFLGQAVRWSFPSAIAAEPIAVYRLGLTGQSRGGGSCNHAGPPGAAHRS